MHGSQSPGTRKALYNCREQHSNPTTLRLITVGVRQPVPGGGRCCVQPAKDQPRDLSAYVWARLQDRGAPQSWARALILNERPLQKQDDVIFVIISVAVLFYFFP